MLAFGCSQKPSLPAGTYYGYEPMGTSLESGTPGAYSYHENVLTVRGTAVHIVKAPLVLDKEKVWSSASDGGFPVLEGSLGNYRRSVLVLSLQRVSHDSCGMVLDERGVSVGSQPREYVIRLDPDGS